MFSGTTPSVFFDQLRIPYRIVDAGSSWAGVGERSPLRETARFQVANGAGPRFLAWPTRAVEEGEASEFQLESLPLYGHLLRDATCADWLGSTGAPWRRTAAIADSEGRRIGAVWRDDAGNAFLPFEPDEVILNFLTEGYRDLISSPLDGAVGAAARRAYYRLKRGVPRDVQLRLRRAFSAVQQKTRFPRWPVEPALIDFSRLLFLLLQDVSRTRVPWISPWPASKAWALVLTHDVETRHGYDNLHLMRDIELAAGCRSSWNFVPSRYERRTRYEVGDDDVRELAELGFEVGVHGLKHDGRDISSLTTLQERIPRMREYAERWNAVGFRSPATHRRWEWMPMLAFDYDSSYSDTDPFEPQAGGCCSWLPYFNGELVELPITLPQDHTLFSILGHRDETVWSEKASLIRRQGGMALALTHPDYMTEPHLLEAYRRFLAEFGRDESGWHALPRDVSSWWRRRAASSLELVHEEWTVVGPAAADASISFDAPEGAR